MRIPLKPVLLASGIALMPLSATAEILELSQSQMRQLVSQQQILGAETIATAVVSDFGGVVLEMRGFLSEGKMTYRILLQREDGAVVELLYNGPNGRRISSNSPMGQVVSSEARSNNGSPTNSTNVNASSNGNSGNLGNSGNRGNSSDRGNSGGSNSGGNSGGSNSGGNSGGGNSGGGNSGGGNSGGGNNNGRGN
jgi:hypothetical protein